jgi:hypothetical protein
LAQPVLSTSSSQRKGDSGYRMSHREMRALRAQGCAPNAFKLPALARSAAKGAPHGGDEFGGKCHALLACSGCIGQDNPHDGAGSLATNQGISGQEEFPEVFTGNYAVPGLVPVKHEFPGAKILDPVLIDLDFFSVDGNQG